MEANELINLIPTLGFPIICVIAVAIAFYRILTRIMDENKEREARKVEEMADHIKSVNSLADLIKEQKQVILNCQELNKELTETNRMIVNDLRVTISNIGNDVKDIKDRLSNS